MKLTLLAIVLLVLCVLIGCSKSDMIEPGSLVTKWTLVNDSVSNSIGASAAYTKNYTGAAGDYFDFRNDGKCYTKEGNNYDTLAYQIIGASKINIEGFGFNSADNPSTIDPFTVHSATITSPDLITPGGISYRVVELKR